jgi:four helix bundle protein
VFRVSVSEKEETFSRTATWTKSRVSKNWRFSKEATNLSCSSIKITKTLPSLEKFGLVPQMTRAAVSLCTNLMEGSHRLNRAGYRQFTGIAKASAGELKYQLMLAKDLGYLVEDEYNRLKFE